MLLLHVHPFLSAGPCANLRKRPRVSGPQHRHELFLILGKLHRQLEPAPAANPQWLSIPKKGLYTGIAALGAIGSGKTRGLILPAMHQLAPTLRIQGRRP